MLLQVYLYHYCAAFLWGLDHCPGLVPMQGVQEIYRLCSQWEAFFTPRMLSNLGGHLDATVATAWEKVQDRGDYLKLLASRCEDLLKQTERSTLTGVGRRLVELRYMLTATVLPRLKELHYYSSESARILVFPSTGKIVTSFVPFCASANVSEAPGVYNPEERAVIEVYLSALCRAPSMVEASGLAGPVNKEAYNWVSGSMIPELYELTSFESRLVAGLNVYPKLYDEIYTAWQRQLNPSKDNKCSC